MSTIIAKRVKVRKTNTPERTYTIRKNTHVAAFSVLTPEQSKFTRPVDMAVLKMTPGRDAELTTNRHEVLEINKTEEHNNRIWLSTPKKHGKNEDHTPMQTIFLKN